MDPLIPPTLDLEYMNRFRNLFGSHWIFDFPAVPLASRRSVSWEGSFKRKFSVNSRSHRSDKEFLIMQPNVCQTDCPYELLMMQVFVKTEK